MGAAPTSRPLTLTGRHVRLEPLSPDHVDDLVAAATEDRSTFGYTWVPGGDPDTVRDDVRRYVDALLAAADEGTAVPFAQRRLDVSDGSYRSGGRAVGCTRYMNLRRWRGRAEPDEVEIGGTWLAASAQRSPVNTEAKLLLLTHAFETWGVWRVDFATDVRNARSRAALERLGARFEGVLHHHRPAADADPPAPRDSAVYAITDADWPSVRARVRDVLGLT